VPAETAEEIFNAAEMGNVDELASLVSVWAGNKAANSGYDHDGCNALQWASYEGNDECVLLLLAAGADIDEEDENCETAIYSAIENELVDTVRILINEGANVNFVSKSGCRGHSILYRAIESGDEEIIAMLEAAGAVLYEFEKDEREEEEEEDYSEEGGAYGIQEEEEEEEEGEEEEEEEA